MSGFAGGGKTSSAGPGACGIVAIATQAQTYYATPYGVVCPYVPSVTNLLLRRQSVQKALFTVALGAAPNARGSGSLDLQSYRGNAVQVASGNYATCVGVSNRADGARSTAVGKQNDCHTYNATAIGYLNVTQSPDASLCGNRNSVGLGAFYGDKGSALGYHNLIANLANAYDASAIGYRNTVNYATKGSAIGAKNTIGTGALQAHYSSAIGYLNSIGVLNSAINAHAVGGRNACNNANGSSAFGYKNTCGSAARSAPFSSAHGYANTIGNLRNSNKASAFGAKNTVNDANVSCFGYGNAVGSAAYYAGRTTVVGYKNTVASTANSYRAVVFGYSCTLNATYGAVAIGYKSQARIQHTTVLQPPIIAPKTNGIVQAQAFALLSGVQNVLYTVEIDFTAAAATQTITLPAGARFFTDAVGVIVEELDGTLTTQISYEFGITGTLAKYLAITAGVVLNTQWNEEKWTNLLADAGETSLTFQITTPGVLNTATKYKGKAFWIGRLIEAEP